MHLWQGYHRSDFVFFPLHPYRWHAVLKCSITDDVHIDHLIKVMSASHLHCDVFRTWWGTLRNFVPNQNFNFYIHLLYQYGFPQWLNGKEFSCQYKRHMRHGFDLWVKMNPGKGNGYPLQYFCQYNPTDRGVWRAIVHGVTESDMTKRTCRHDTLYQDGPLASYFIPIIMSHNPFSSVQFICSVMSTLCYPINHSTAGLPVLHELPESTQTHVHWVGDVIQPSHPLLCPSPPALNLSQHQGLFQWVSCSHQVAKVLEFQLQHQSFQWTPRTDLL